MGEQTAPSPTDVIPSAVDAERRQRVEEPALSLPKGSAFGFYRDHFNPYLNYHRPCAQPEVSIDARGRKRVRYRRYRTPLEVLMALEEPARHLRPGFEIDTLRRIALALSDTDAARRKQQAKTRLFERFRSTA